MADCCWILDVPEGRFLDWPSRADKDATHAGLQALLVMTLESGKELCETLGESAHAEKCVDTVKRLRKHTPDPGKGKQAAALMGLAKLQDAKQLNDQEPD